MSEEQSQEQQEQQKKNPAVTYLGPCPVCGKGQIAEGNVVYRCNYIKDLKDDKCDFRIFKTYLDLANLSRWSTPTSDNMRPKVFLWLFMISNFLTLRR